MAEKVYLHLGAPKTGTTFLQRVLWKNREALRAQGVLFPGRRFIDRVQSTSVVRELHPLMDTEPVASSWARLVEETQAFPGTVVISHEYFAPATEAQAQRALEALAPAEIHLVYTMRDYVRLIPALWQEKVKFKASVPLASYEPPPLDAGPHAVFGWAAIDPLDVLRRWGKDVPPDRIHVVTVPPSGAPKDLLWRRFAAVCGIDPDSCDLDVSTANESLGVVEIELLRRVNPRLGEEFKPTIEQARWIRDYLAWGILQQRRSARFGLDPESAEVMRERSIALARALEQTEYDIVGDLSDLIPPTDLPELAHPSDVTTEQLLDASLDVIATLTSDVRKRTQERDRARKALAKSQEATPSGVNGPAGDAGGSLDTGRRVLSALRRRAGALRRRV